MSLNVSKIRADVVHWLLTASAIMYGILEVGNYLKWIPGRYGHLAATFFALLGGIYLIVLKVEKRLASPDEVSQALINSASDVNAALPSVEKEITDFVDATKPFAPKTK